MARACQGSQKQAHGQPGARDLASDVPARAVPQTGPNGLGRSVMAENPEVGTRVSIRIASVASPSKATLSHCGHRTQ